MVPLDRLERLRERMQRLHELRPHFPVDGRSLTEDELSVFEAAHGIELPEGYRDFLLEFGDEAGITAITTDRALPLGARDADPIYACFAGPLPEAFRYQGSEPIALERDEQTDDYVRYDVLSGSICLGSGGCDEIYVVVVHGEVRGTVWSFVPGLDKELHPQGEFLDWCLSRTERTIAEYERYARLQADR